jgi:phage regulator Rha-like protein
MENENLPGIPDEVIMNKIFLIRGKKVMLDRDLAILYDIETKRLKEQVRRNIERFPNDFMFDLSYQEVTILRSQFATSSWGGVRYSPMAFSEHGVLMLASVLNSKKAIQINIQIVRVFTKMREMLTSQKDIVNRLDNTESKLAEHDDQILLIFEYLKQMEKAKEEEPDKEPRKVVEGYRKGQSDK